MAADEYVQAAAAHLQSAATALKTDMEKIRGEFMTYDRQVAHDINTKEAEMRSLGALAATSKDPESARHHMDEAQRLRKEIDQLKQDLEQRRSQMTQDIKAKEGAMNDLMNQSRGLQNKAGSLK